jgi:4-hydroxybenzoate polyprenyltransferase
MTPEHAKRYAWGLMALGMITSVVASYLGRTYHIVLLWSAFTLLGIAYSMPPLKLKARHIWGNLCFSVFVILAFFIGQILVTNTITLVTVIMYLLYVPYITGMITMKDFQDVEGDQTHGDISLPVKVGRIKAAVISIGLMASTVLISNLFNKALNPYWRPPASLGEFIAQNWAFLILVGSFAVYIVLDSVRRDHVISGAYSRVIYFYLIFVVGYGFLKTALIPWNVLAVVGLYERYIELAVYVLVASVTVFRSYKTGVDVLKDQ